MALPTLKKSHSPIILLADSKFSLIIDEGKDISVTQALAIVIRFLRNSSIRDVLLDIKVEDGSSETMYSTVRNILQKMIYRYKIIILRFAAVNCATLMGKHS